MVFRIVVENIGHVLGAFNNNSVGLRVVGVDVEREADVTKLDKHLKEGEWLSGEYAEVVIGYKLQKNLQLKLGSELVLIGQGADGSIASAIFKVVGVLKGVNALTDKRSIFISDESFDELFLFQGKVHEYIFGFSEEDETSGLKP